MNQDNLQIVSLGNKLRILVTGASGFVASGLIKKLAQDPTSYSVIAASRTACAQPFVNVESVKANLLGEENWADLLSGVDTVIHTAGLTQVVKSSDAERQLQRVNVDGTLNLAKQAANSGVKRFVFLSSIKVNGETTKVGQPFTEEDSPNPVGDYAISKHRAEIGIMRLAKECNMEVVIIRPPLVYGCGVKGNFEKMLSWISRGIPLPLAAIKNKRSLISLENLVDFIIVSAHHPKAANHIFLVKDDCDLSTPGMLYRIGEAMGKPVRMITLPVSWVIFIASIFGRKDIAQRLCGSLQADSSKARLLLGWKPIVSIDEGFQKAVNVRNK